jgi:pimeloyl-ACP methyl ester carboxylesterase
MIAPRRRWHSLQPVISGALRPGLDANAATDRAGFQPRLCILHERIAGSRLVMLPHAGHMLMTDQPEALHEAVLEFLAASGPRPAQIGRAI